jgi:flagellar biosynthesis component FlhA
VIVRHPVLTVKIMIRHLLSRLGCMFLMVGVLLLVLGIAAERSGQPAFNFLIFGALLFLGGLVLWGKLRQKPRQNTRFSLFRKRKADDQAENELDDRGW